jgi:hypothetical protein
MRQAMRATAAWLGRMGLLLLLAVAAPAWAQFDHTHARWNGLLQKHVRWLDDKVQSGVDYAGFMAERAALKQVLDAYSAVAPAEFAGFDSKQQMAFLINAYNAFTVELILTRYPDLKSIKDLGSLFTSPWKIQFFTLLGKEHHLDWIEHEQLRPKFADPRIHAAVNCASIGCPALRPEAFVAPKLEAQLDDGMQRFLADRTRNRVADGKLELNSIFKWYREDFETGSGGLAGYMAAHAAQLGRTPAEQQQVRERKLPIVFLDYDWSLNVQAR